MREKSNEMRQLQPSISESVLVRSEPEARTSEITILPLLLTIPQAAHLLSLSRAKLYQLLQSGELPSVRIGRAVRLSYVSLQRWIEQQEH